MEDDDTSARTGYSAYSKTPNTARSSSRDRFRPVTPISESSEPVGHAPRSFHQARILSSLAQPQPHLAHAIAPHIPTRSLFAAASTLALSSSTPARRSQKSVPRGSSMPSNDEHTLTDKRLKCSADRSEHTESRAAASPVELGFPANEDANSGQKSRLASSSRTGSKDIQPSVGQSVGETLCLEQRQLSRPAGEPSIRLADDFADSACAPITPHSHGIREPQTLLPTRYIARPTSRQSQRSSGTSPNASSYLDITCGQLDFKPPAAISDDEKSSPSGKNGPRFAHAEALDDQRPVAPVGQFMSLRTTRPSEKFAALRGRRPMHSRASEGSHQPPAATVSGKASLLSSRVISESQLRPSPATSPNHTPTSETFESRIPGPRRQQGSIMGNTPLQLTSRHPPASRLKAELDPSQPSEVLAPRKSSSASTSGASTLASSGDSSRTFVHDSTSLVVPAQSMDSLDKRTHLRLFATNPDALTSSSTESIGLVDVKMDPLVPPPRSFTPQSVPATPDPTRQIPETHRLTALMDGLGLTAEHPNQGSSIPTPLAATGRCEIEATEHAKLTCGSQRKPSHGFRRVSHEGLQPEWAPPAVENPPSSTETCARHISRRSSRVASPASQVVGSRPQSRASSRGRSKESPRSPEAHYWTTSRLQSETSSTGPELSCQPLSHVSKRSSYHFRPLSPPGTESYANPMSHSQYRVSPIGSDGFEYPSHFPEQHDSSVDGLEDEDEDIEDDTDIWTPVDERFNRDYLPEHHMRNDDLPSLGDEQHQNNFGDHGEIIHHHRKHSKLGLQVQTLTSTIQPALINAHLSETDVSTSGSFSQNDWHPPNDARISIAAEALFQHLKTTPAHHPAPLSSSSAADTVTCDIGSAISSFPQPPFESTASPVTSTDSVARNVNPGSNRSWKSTITPAAFRSLVSRHGNVEMHRQEAIWNLCESEQAFLQDIRLILQTFVQPLRTQDKKWLPGVPTDVARLFDWLDDIIQLHTHLHSAVYAARSNQYPVVLHVAETLRPFVSRLELYQPYLGKLEQVITVIKNSLSDTGSDFGEFVRMQMAHVSELRGASLVDLLQLPAERVSAYPRLFHELWQLSPRSHPDHLATLSLTHSTAIVVQALLEVCSREEEHDRIKELSARITGLPRHFNLAKRGRRLVAQGLIQRIQLMDAELAALERFEPSAVDGNVSPCMPILSPRYLTADHAREPSASLGSSSWLHAENTLKAALTRSRSASNSDKSTGKPQHDDISFRRDTPSPVLTRQRHGVVYAWVFTDLVLFASLTQTTSAKEECWTLVEDIGLSRVTAVNDLSGGLGYDNLIALDLLPMAQERGGVNVAPLHSSPFAVFFTPYRSTSQRISGRVLDESARIWLQAFEKCFLFTLRSLSFPCLGDHLAHGPDADLEMDTKASVVSILSVGLPLPKSPSQLIIDNETGRLPDTIEDERAERGWWAVRFRQVLRDLQRQDIAPTAFGANYLRPPQLIVSLPTVEVADVSTSSDSHIFRADRRRSVVTSRPLLLSPNPRALTRRLHPS